MKLGVTALPLAGLLNGSYSPAFASTSSRLQNESAEAASPEALNDLKTPAGAPFMADYVFSGSALSGWHGFGQADWRAENGEIIGKAHPGSNGGWLVLDKSYQDVIFFGRFRAPAGSKTGVLVRAEKSPGGGLKGIFFS